MQRTLIDLDFGRQPRGSVGFAQHVLHFGLAFVIILGDGEQEVRVHLLDQQMRAVRLAGDEPAAMEGCASADAVGARPRGSHRDRSAHAVSGGADLAIRIN